MPFTKGNTFWADGHKARAENKEHLAEFIANVASGAIEIYADKLKDLAHGVELSKPETEFMDREERLFEFGARKLTRTEITGKDGTEFKGVNVYLPSHERVEATQKTGEGSIESVL